MRASRGPTQVTAVPDSAATIGMAPNMAPADAIYNVYLHGDRSSRCRPGGPDRAVVASAALDCHSERRPCGDLQKISFSNKGLDILEREPAPHGDVGVAAGEANALEPRVHDHGLFQTDLALGKRSFFREG